MGANRRAQERARLVALAAEQAKRAEAEAKAIVDAQEIVAIWNAERVVSQLADREARPVAFLSWDRTAERTERGGRYHLTTR